MIGSEFENGMQLYRRQRRDPGKASLNRGIVALVVALAGNLIGFVIPLAVSSLRSPEGAFDGRLVFMPLGGIAALFLAILAIVIGSRVKRFIGSLSGHQRDRIGTYMDLDKEAGRASLGIFLGIISIAVNPLLAFGLISLLRVP